MQGMKFNGNTQLRSSQTRKFIRGTHFKAVVLNWDAAVLKYREMILSGVPPVITFIDL